MSWRLALCLLVANLALAGVLRLGVPGQPAYSDQDAYDYVGRHGLGADCPFSVYCYRVLVPALVEAMPGAHDRRWRAYEYLSTSLAAFVTSVAVARLVPMWQAPWLATLAAQTTFGFTFTAYDPYSADPMVFLMAALLLLAWLRDWPWAALGLASIGVFAKETVALVAVSAGLAAVVRGTAPTRRWWVGQAGVACALLLGFHWVMDTYRGWGISINPASKFFEGAWLAVWLENMDSPWRIAFLLFVPFGLGWVYAWLGYRTAPDRLRALALGSIGPMLALNYVQNPERALGNAFFVVVPLVVVFLSRVPPPAAFTAVVTNGLLTAKVGLSTPWLPPSRVLMIPAVAAALWVAWLAKPAAAARAGD